MSDTPQGSNWWKASDGRWYPPEQQPQFKASAAGRPASATVEQLGRSGLSTIFAIVGAVILIGGVLVGLILLAEGGSSAGFGVGIALGSILQACFFFAISEVLKYLKAIATLQATSAAGR